MPEQKVSNIHVNALHAEVAEIVRFLCESAQPSVDASYAAQGLPAAGPAYFRAILGQALSDAGVSDANIPDAADDRLAVLQGVAQIRARIRVVLQRAADTLDMYE